MSSTIFTIPAGQSAILPAPALSSICVQPGAGGSALLQYGPDGVSPIFVSAPQGANTAPYSFCPSTYNNNIANPMGNIGKVQVTATTTPAVVIVSDLQQYPGSFPERQTVAASSVAYATINGTAEQNLFSMRFPPGFLKPNFQLELFYQLTLTNSANVKTFKAYFGPSTNSATAAALEGGTAIQSNVYTSMIGAMGIVAGGGRNDNQTFIASNGGLLSAGGWGSSTVANVSVANCNYGGPAAVEQVLAITATKATGAEVFTLDRVLVKVYQ
jgi:hypothetical protein